MQWPCLKSLRKCISTIDRSVSYAKQLMQLVRQAIAAVSCRKIPITMDVLVFKAADVACLLPGAAHLHHVPLSPLLSLAAVAVVAGRDGWQHKCIYVL